MDIDGQSSLYADNCSQIWEVIRAGQLSALTDSDDLYPYLPLLSRIALAHELRPQDEGPFPGLVTKLQRYKDADKCRSYALLKWHELLQPVKSQMLEVKRLIGSSTTEQAAETSTMDVEEENLAQTLGHGLVTEYECSNDSRRMQILVSELARLVKEDFTHKAPDLRSMLLSKEAIQEDLKLMLPFALYRCSLFFNVESVVKALRQVDDRLVLVKSVVSNCPSSVEGIVSSLIDQISQGSSRYFARNSQPKPQAPLSNKQDSAPDPDSQWWSRVLEHVASLSLANARRVRQELMNATVLPELVMSITVLMVKDSLAFLLSHTHGHEWLWEYIHSTLSTDAVAVKSSNGSPGQLAVYKLLSAMSNSLSTVTSSSTPSSDLGIHSPDQSSDGRKSATVMADCDEDVEVLGDHGAAGLLKLYCAMIALGSMQPSLQEVLGSSALPVHGNVAKAQAGLFYILCRGRAGGFQEAEGAEGKGAGRIFSGEERLLAFCALILWPRLKSVIPQHVVTASIKSLWNASSAPAVPKADSSTRSSPLASPTAASAGESLGSSGGVQDGNEAVNSTQMAVEPGSQGGGGTAAAPTAAAGVGVGLGGATECGEVDDVTILLSLFVTRDLVAVGELVRTATGLSCHVQGESLNKLADMIAEGTDVKQLSRAVLGYESSVEGSSGPGGVSPLKESSMRESARIQCVYSLARDGKLISSVQDGERFNRWLLHVMGNAPFPLPNVLPQLLEESAKMACMERSKVVGLPLPALKSLLEARESELLEGREMSSSDQSKSKSTGAILAAYYLLSRRSQWISKQVESGTRRRQLPPRSMAIRRMQDERGAIGPEMEAMVAMLPLKVYLQEIEQGGYQAIQPQFLQMVVEQFPEVLLDSHRSIASVGTDPTLQDALKSCSSSTTSSSSSSAPASSLLTPSPPLPFPLDHRRARNAFLNYSSNPQACLLILDVLSRLPDGELEQFAGLLLMILLPRMLVQQVSGSTDQSAQPSPSVIAPLFEALWDRLLARHPCPIVAKTSYSLLHYKSLVACEEDASISSDSLFMGWKCWGWGAPELGRLTGRVFDINTSGLSGGEAFEFSLLSFHESLSRDVLTILSIDDHIFHEPSLLRIVLSCLALYQTISEISFDHEVSKSQKMDEKMLDEQLSVIVNTQNSAIIQILLEICLPFVEDDSLLAIENRKAICQYIHRVFIKNTILVKLVHFQGYNPKLIKCLVDNVPAMHICREWLPELLSQPDPRTRSFAVLLAGHVAHKWPLKETEKLVNLALHRIREAASSDDRASLREMIPILPIMAVTFPRTGLEEAVPVAQQAVKVLVQVKFDTSTEEDEEEKLDGLIDEAMTAIMERVLLLQGVAV